MDYDDQMVFALRILRRYPDILAHFQSKYPYLCVDEAQDTCRKIQHAILPPAGCPEPRTCSWWGTRIRASTASGRPGPRR